MPGDFGAKATVCQAAECLSEGVILDTHHFITKFLKNDVTLDLYERSAGISTLEIFLKEHTHYMHILIHSYIYTCI